VLAVGTHLAYTDAGEVKVREGRQPKVTAVDALSGQAGVQALGR
jgi:hypothetical protein